MHVSHFLTELTRWLLFSTSSFRFVLLYAPDSRTTVWVSITVKLLIQAGSQIEAGSPIQAGGFRSLVSIEAGSLIEAGSPLQAG